ncbi:hypothetical protein [Marinospirillum alkaliphilum]|uniref:Tetratricopeptide repeat-containing protein n=1 Tax=Marinospirillum alkaliphilum DSM 21637 TaxID=1122209 RepID=A0A1K1UYJ2_9GAMM|nr:hypothetical protein [Marinospirillum alkaliphilum]SFX17922.1 hypothetical protein SAMN02745752_00676 [Marinospirillum alkaliphilum DSM 21637]
MKVIAGLISGLVLLLVVGKIQADAVPLTPRQYEQLNQLGELLVTDQQAALQKGDELFRQPGGTAEQRAFVRAFAARVLAQIHQQQEQLDRAVDVIELALQDQQQLDQQSVQSLRWQLMQLRVAQGDYAAALQVLESWWQDEATPEAEAHYLRAALLAQLERWKQAEPWVMQALQQRKELSQQQPDAWLALAVVIHQQLQQWPEAAALQHQRVLQTPERSPLWGQLAQLQQLARQEQQALVTLELAQRGGHLNDREQFELGRSLLLAQQPLRAARVFEQLLETDKEPSERLLQMTAQAWLQTTQQQETAQALQRLAHATGKVGDWRRLGDWHFSQGNWQAAIDAWQLVTQEERLEARDKARLELLMANAWIELQEYAQARKLLENLLASSEAAAARQWLNYLNALPAD